MSDKTWERCYREWSWGREATAAKEAYGAGWRAALSQCLARLEDEESDAGPGLPRHPVEEDWALCEMCQQKFRARGGLTLHRTRMHAVQTT